MPANWKAETLSAPAPTRENSLITPEKLMQLYTMMLRLRSISDGLPRNSTSRRQRLPFQEACEIGCTVDLREDDLISTLPNQYVAYVRSGVRPEKFPRKIRRRRSDIDSELTTSLNVLDVQSDRLVLATGASFALKTRHSDSVVVAFCQLREVVRAEDSIYFAMRLRLPIIYVQLSDSSLKSGKKQQLHYPTITAIPVEQNDVVAIYRVASEAIDKARRGVGPTLIQCVNYLSSKKNGFASHPNDPIVYMEHFLRKKNLWPAAISPG